MMNGQTDNVKIFMQEIQSLVYNHIIHEDNLVKLLQTKSANETPGLYISMLYGFDEIIDIFLNALTTPIAQELLNKKMVMDILAMKTGNDSNLLIVFYVQIMPDDFVMQLHRF